MLLDNYKALSENSNEALEEQKIMQEDFDMIVEWLRESGYADMSDEYSVYNEATVSTKKLDGKVRAFSKEHYYNLTKSMAALSAAKAKNDPQYRKLVKVSRLRKKLIASLNKKYQGVAKKEAKAALRAAKKTGQTIVKSNIGGSTAVKPIIKK